jgi:translocation and assembly module TamA
LKLAVKNFGVMCLVVAAAACLPLPPTPDSRLVDDLTIESSGTVDTSRIEDKIVTSESFLPGWPFVGKAGWYDPISWQADLRRVRRYYEAQGFYKARILQESVSVLPNSHVTLKVNVDEGPAFRLTRLQVTGLENLNAENRFLLSEAPSLKTGDIFVEAAWEKSKATLVGLLREAGYAEALLTAEAQVNVDRHVVEASLNVQPGKQFHFGNIFVAQEPGAKVPAAFISDIASVDVSAASLFSESALKNAQARLFQQGVFSGVRVTRGAPNAEAQTVPVIVDVREAPFHSVRFGFGANGDLNRNEARLLAEYVNRNVGFSQLFNKNLVLDKLTVKAKAGWAFVPNIFEVLAQNSSAKQGPVGAIQAEYEVPRVFGFRTLSFVTSAEASRVLDNALTYFGGDARIGFKWQPLVQLTVTPTARVSAYQLTTKASLRDNVPQAVVGCPVEPALCLIGLIDVNVEFDRRDRKLEASRGFYFSFNTSIGLSGTNPFLKVVPEARVYTSFGPEQRLTLAAKLKLGTIFAPNNETPILVRFFSGGSAMRGFGQRRLSPLVGLPSIVSVEDPNCATPGSNCRNVLQPDYVRGDTQPIGGNGLGEFSLELRLRFLESWSVAIFNDWGLVTAQPLGGQTDIASSLYAAVGLGLRYLSPLGPLRADLGVRLPFIGGPQRVDLQELKSFQSSPGCFGLGVSKPEPQAAALSYGGSPDGLCNVHLSIGEAF